MNITNQNTGKVFTAETDANSNYYQFMLANGTDLNASDILRFNVTSPSGNQSNITEHAVMQEEVNNGSFELNITLAPYIVKNSNSPTGTNVLNLNHKHHRFFQRSDELIYVE